MSFTWRWIAYNIVTEASHTNRVNTTLVVWLAAGLFFLAVLAVLLSL